MEESWWSARRAWTIAVWQQADKYAVPRGTPSSSSSSSSSSLHSALQWENMHRPPDSDQLTSPSHSTMGSGSPHTLTPNLTCPHLTLIPHPHTSPSHSTMGSGSNLTLPHLTAPHLPSPALTCLPSLTLISPSHRTKGRGSPHPTPLLTSPSPLPSSPPKNTIAHLGSPPRERRSHFEVYFTARFKGKSVPCTMNELYQTGATREAAYSHCTMGNNSRKRVTQNPRPSEA